MVCSSGWSQTHYVAQVAFYLIILLPSAESDDYVPPHNVSQSLFIGVFYVSIKMVVTLRNFFLPKNSSRIWHKETVVSSLLWEVDV